MNWTPLDLTVRVGCNFAYQRSVPTSVLFALKPQFNQLWDASKAALKAKK